MKNFVFTGLLILILAPAAEAASARKSTACTGDPRCGEFVEFFKMEDRAGLDIFPIFSNAARYCLEYSSGRFVSYVQPDGSLALTCTAPRWP